MTVVTRRGIAADGFATMPEFMGSRACTTGNDGDRRPREGGTSMNRFVLAGAGGLGREVFSWARDHVGPDGPVA